MDPRHPDDLDYEVRRTRRKSVAILVRDDGSIEVRAPTRASAREIKRVVALHRDWALERQRVHRARWQRQAARHFDPGDEIPFVGQTLTLVVREVEGAVPRCVLSETDLVVTISASLSVAERRAVTRESVGIWLMGQARDLFHERHIQAARLVGDSALRVTIKDMRSRWGSCGPSRRMSLCWRLILAPLDVIDYVLVHELTHIRHPDHSRRFWDAVATACPHWRTSRDWLTANGADLRL